MSGRQILLCGIVAGVAAMAAPGGAAEAPAAREPIAAAREALDRVQAQTDRLRAELPSAQQRFETAPPPFAAALAQARAEVAAAVLSLQGEPWAGVDPLLQRAARVRRDMGLVQGALDAWSGRQPRERARPARAVAGTGHISGRIVDARTGAALSAAYVYIYDQSGAFVDVADADADGRYASDGLDGGTYFVVAEDYDYIDELYDDIPCETSCDETTGTPVTVVDGQTTNGIDFALLPLSTISGIVLDEASDLPLRDTRVEVYTASGSYAGGTYVGDDGTYLVGRLPAGTYFAVAQHAYYLDEAYDNRLCELHCQPQAVGTPITVPPAMAITGIDFRLAPGGSVSGHLTDAATGAPISGEVLVFDAGGQVVADVSTVEGRYQAYDLPTGTYFARTDTYTHADQLYSGIPCEPSCSATQGTPIQVTAGQEQGGVDFVLTRFGSFSGVVRDAGTGAPVPGVQVNAVSSQGNWFGLSFTDAQGRYAMGGLNSGSYFAYTRSDPYLDELYDGFPCEPSCQATTGTPIAVTLGADHGGIDFSLDRGGRITGQVRTQLGGVPFYSAFVTLYRSNGTQADTTFTGNQGIYVFEGLPAGTYFAVAFSPQYVPELYRELACPTPCTPTAGTPIPVAVAQDVIGIDFTLSALGRIAGRVTAAGTGLPIPTWVDVYTQSGSLAGSAPASSGGFYVLTGLAPGTYYVRTNTSPDDTIVDELYDNKTCEPSCNVTTGTPVAAALDVTTGGIDFVLRKARFADVPVTHFAWAAVEAVYAAGVTSGCGTSPLRFCPDASVSRAQMAVFLLRAKLGPGYVPPAAQGLFQDVPATDPFAPWIEDLANRGIASGCSSNPPLYCPGSPTTRGAMAPLLLVTREGTGYQPPAAVGLFQDLPPSNLFARWAEELVRRHVTSGCNLSPPLYCPGAATTRAQMAVFLTATFGLPLP